MARRERPDLAERRAIVVDILSQAVMALAVEREARRSDVVAGSALAVGDSADQIAGHEGDGPQPRGLLVRGTRR